MMKWWTIAFTILFIAFCLNLTSKQQRMKTCIEQFQRARSQAMHEHCINQGKAMMCTKLLPYVLSSYRDERDIQFTVAMLGVCRTAKDHAILWETARADSTDQEVRIICMAQLLSRDQLKVWGEITEKDIEMIAHSMPVHIVHWKYLLLKYSGSPPSVLNRDTFPERHKFKALFRDCLEKHRANETRRLMLNPEATPP